jgi:D-alanine-D-alanine ligase
VVIDPGARALVQRHVTASAALELDLVFPLVHGWGGEDCRLQGLLDLAGIPCAGPGLLGSAVAMDKAVAKLLLRAAGLPVVPWVTVLREDWRADAGAVLGEVAPLGTPVFVKPANGGSSVGVSRAGSVADIPRAIDAALECDRRVLVERAVDAREIECAVMGNDEPQASVLGEIVPSGEFYDYAAKYLDGASRLYIPADLPAAAAERIRAAAVAGFRALDLSGFARVDFLLDRRSGEAYLNEINTLPGFTPISMFPKLWEASGVPFPALLERLVSLALDRAREDRRRRTRWREG